MISTRIKTFLDENDIQYSTISHYQTFTAQQLAATTHINAKKIAKTVIMKVDGEIAMAVLPGSYRIDLDTLKEVTGLHDVEIAKEHEFMYRFPECEIGAMSPFGNLYGMEVYCADSLKEDKAIVFNAGTHTELIKMLYRDFERLVNPKIVAFSY